MFSELLKTPVNRVHIAANIDQSFLTEFHAKRFSKIHDSGNDRICLALEVLMLLACSCGSLSCTLQRKTGTVGC